MSNVINMWSPRRRNPRHSRALITFEPHPRCVLGPGNCPQSITSLQEKLALIEAAGVEHAIVLRFDRELASLSPQEFIERLAAVMDLASLGLGYDFRIRPRPHRQRAVLREHGHQVEGRASFQDRRGTTCTALRFAG